MARKQSPGRNHLSDTPVEVTPGGTKYYMSDVYVDGEKFLSPCCKATWYEGYLMTGLCAKCFKVYNVSMLLEESGAKFVEGRWTYLKI